MFTKLGVIQGATKYNKDDKQLQVKNVVLHIIRHLQIKIGNNFYMIVV